MSQSGYARAPAVVNLAGLPRRIGYGPLAPALSGFFFVLFGLFAWAGDREPTEERRLVILLLFGALSALCGLLLVRSLVTGIRLEADRVVATGLFGSRTLLRSEIAGYERTGAAPSPGPLRLIPSTPGVRPIVLIGVRWRKADPVLESWLGGYIDLTPEVPPPPVIWTGSMARLKQVSLALNLLAIAVGAWVTLLPMPYAMACLAAAVTPWLGVAAVRITYGAMAFDPPRGQTQPRAIFILLWPTLGLMIRPIIDINIYDWSPTLFAAIGGGLLAVGGFALLFPWLRASRPMWWALPALFGLAYGFGVYVNGDRIAERAPPQVFETEVVDKTISHGRSTSYHLELGPWGPRRESQSVTVRYDVFSAVHIGGRACVSLHPGGLGMRWYTVQPCG